MELHCMPNDIGYLVDIGRHPSSSLNEGYGAEQVSVRHKDEELHVPESHMKHNRETSPGTYPKELSLNEVQQDPVRTSSPAFRFL